jgi:hypothetical protein
MVVTAVVMLGAAFAVAQSLPNNAGPYPGNQYPQPLRLGMWNHIQLGAVTPYGEDLLNNKTYWGLSMYDMYSDVLVYDERGNFYVIVVQERNINGGVHATFSIGWHSSPTGLVPLGCTRAISGDMTQTLSSDNHLNYTGTDSAGQKESITFGPKRYEWTSTDPNYINLHGYLPTQSIPYYLSWRDPKGGTDALYANLTQYVVTGTLCGMHVHGFTQQEHYWGPGGYGLSWWGQNRRGLYSFFTNKYSDGTFEHGVMFCGPYGARGAMVVNSKGETVLDSNQVNAQKSGPNGLSVKLEFPGGQKWEIVNDPSQTLTGTDALFGTFKRVGDKRKIVEHVGSYAVFDLCKHEPLTNPAG